MTPYDFNQIVSSADLEAATHVVFNQAYMKWITEGPEALTEGEMTVYCVETFFGEVCNGGLVQYLDNESGALAEHCSEALNRVGLPRYASIAIELLSRCAKRYYEFEDDDDDPRAPHFQWVFKRDDVREPFADLDDEFFEDLDGEFFSLYFADKSEFRRRLFQYIVEHESEFVSVDS